MAQQDIKPKEFVSNEDIKGSISAAMKELYKRSGKPSHKEFANMCGISKSTFARALNGKLSLMTAIQISDACCVSLDFIYKFDKTLKPTVTPWEQHIIPTIQEMEFSRVKYAIPAVIVSASVATFFEDIWKAEQAKLPEKLLQEVKTQARAALSKRGPDTDKTERVYALIPVEKFLCAMQLDDLDIRPALE